MTDTNTKEAWDRFQADVKTLAGEIRRNCEDAEDEKKTAEINSSMRQLGQAADAFFESLGAATRDPEVRASTKQAARSFGSALGETFHEVSAELGKAFRQAPAPK